MTDKEEDEAELFHNVFPDALRSVADMQLFPYQRLHLAQYPPGRNIVPADEDRSSGDHADCIRNGARYRFPRLLP